MAILLADFFNSPVAVLHADYQLKHFCVIEYCETPQLETGYRLAKSLTEKEAEMDLFCAELRVEFNNHCEPNGSHWGDFCYIRNERIEGFCS